MNRKDLPYLPDPEPCRIMGLPMELTPVEKAMELHRLELALHCLIVRLGARNQAIRIVRSDSDRYILPDWSPTEPWESLAESITRSDSIRQWVDAIGDATGCDEYSVLVDSKGEIWRVQLIHHLTTLDRLGCDI